MSSASDRRGPGLRRRLLLGYLALLAASHLVGCLRSGAPEPGPDARVLELLAVDGDARTDQLVRLVWHDAPAEAGADAPTLLVLHGSPGSRHDFDGFTRALGGRFRVIAPDLPGFGASRQDLPDYSSRAHARYCLDLLEDLGVERAHVVGFSLGGVVAANLTDLAPERVASLTLLSSTGVQEHELFGDARLNHLVHGLQLGAVRAATLLLPHFGWLDRAFFGRAYARNFYDTDQRPVRGMLERWGGPTLVLHGRKDFLVPPEAAEEHHRILPQSELVWLDGGHLLLFLKPAVVAEAVAGFVDRVESGAARTRATAEPARLAAAAVPFDPRAIAPAAGFALLLLAFGLVAATWVSEDLTCIAAGLLVAQGRLDFWPAATACLIGITSGDVGLFLAGRWLGRPAVKRAPLRWVVSEWRVERASAWFERRGLAAILLSRLMPGLRLPTYFAAGVLRTSLWRFGLWFLLAGILWTPFLVGLSAWAGEQVEDSIALFERWSLPVLLLLLASFFLVERLALPMCTARGRRLLLGSVRRKLRWEFWPPWAFYPPVVLYVCWLALRHRSLALVTAVNPAIPGGGFIGESKSAILAGLHAAPELVARHLLLRADEQPERRVERARAFLAEAGLAFPVVLKPDIGQRGSGVLILADEPRLERHLRELAVDSILQEYVPGPEFGVFWLREPGADRGRIFSITDKRLPVVTGDGERTLEQLILADDRAVCAASTYLEANAERLLDVPAAGERVELVHLGTHCRGAIFLDGRELATPAVEEVFERLSAGFDGFCFGRYDVRAASREDFAAGRGFKVIELNGLTSEATHIYDPRTDLLTAYRTLFEQWRLAFAIARANRDRGARPARLRAMLRELLGYQELKRAHSSQ